MKKLFTLALLTFAVVCFGALPALATSSTSTHTQNVTIHKLSLAPSVFNDPQYPKAHDGSQLDLAATFGAGNATELNGVTFTYFRVDQNATLNAMTDDQLKALTPAQLQAAPYNLTAQTITTDGSDGATLAALADGRYVFFETAYSGTGTIANQKAVPFVLTLPVTNAAGTGYVDPIHIYPKNLVENPPSVDKDVTAIGTDADTFDIGATQTWLITTDIPEGIATSTEYVVTDNLTKGLTYTGNPTLAYAQGGDFNLTLGTDYTVSVPVDGTAGPTSFSVTFTAAGRAKLDPAKDLRITFTSVINKDAVMGVTIPNNVQLNYTNANGYNYGGAVTPENDGNTATNSPTVVTGGQAV